MNGEEISKIQIEQYQKRKEKANLLEKIQTLENDISKIKSENGSLRSKLSQDAIDAQKANQAYRETVEKANAAIVEAKKKLEMSRELIECNELESHDEKIKVLKENQNQVQMQIEKKSKSEVSLANMLDMFKKLQESRIQNNIKFREDYKSKMAGISKLTESISKNQQQTRELNQQINQRSKSTKILKEKIAKNEAELVDYEQSIDSVQEKIKIKVAEVQDQNSRLQDLNAKTGEIQRHIDFVQDVSSKEKEKLNQKLNEIRAKEEESVAALELERDGLQADKQAKIDQAEKDKLEFENIQKEIEAKEMTKTDVNESLIDLNKLQNEYEKKLDNQEKSIQDIQERVEALSNERTIVKNKILETKEEVLDSENEISRIKRKLNRKKSDIEEKREDPVFRTYKKIKATEDALNKELSSKQEAMSDLQKRQSELEMELTEATKKECSTKIEVEKLESELGQKTEEITEEKNKIEEIEREANQVKAQIDEIKNDLALKANERTDILERIESTNSNVSDEVLQKLKIQIDLDQKNVSQLENQNSEFASIMESINLDLKVNNEKLSAMQVEHEQLETKIKEGQDQLIVKREEYLKFNKRKEQFALAQGTLEALKEELIERTEHLAQLKIKNEQTNAEKDEQLMELSKRSNAKLEEANEEELRQNKAIANFFNLDISSINAMTTDELKAKVEHEKLYDETDMAQIEGVIRAKEIQLNEMESYLQQNAKTIDAVAKEKEAGKKQKENRKALKASTSANKTTPKPSTKMDFSQMMKIKEEEETPPICHIRAPPRKPSNHVPIDINDDSDFELPVRQTPQNSRSVGSKSKGMGSAKLPRKVKKSDMLKKTSQSTIDRKCSFPSRSQRERQLAERENLLDTSDSSQIGMGFNERRSVKHRMDADSDDIFD